MSAENLYTPFCIRTSAGNYINVTKIKPEDILIEDIAISLARECRFGNFTQKYYSVAEHSIWCMQEAERDFPDDKSLQLAVLLHDAHEAYLGDLCTPLVDAIDKMYSPDGIPFKNIIEDVKMIVQLAIHQRFGIAHISPKDERIKAIDKAALEYEWDAKVLRWSGPPPVADKHIAEIFIAYFKRLVKTPAYKAA